MWEVRGEFFWELAVGVGDSDLQRTWWSGGLYVLMMGRVSGFNSARYCCGLTIVVASRVMGRTIEKRLCLLLLFSVALGY